jgi:predicted DNA-binding protein (MmcQ/YjbR family)
MYGEKELQKKLLTYDGADLSYPFGDKAAVYKVGGKVFALVAVGSDPVRLSLKCDPHLAELLREKYESVLPGYHLNKRHWNTLILSGQIEKSEVDDLVTHSYRLVTGAD